MPIPFPNEHGLGEAGLDTLPVINESSAVFLDFDGTLVDIAAHPDAVVVPAELPDLLARLADKLGGALALVSGRPLAELDQFLPGLDLPTAAEHGAHCRMPDGSVIWAATPDMQDVVRRTTLLAAQHIGLQAEVKSSAVALHYRHAPHLQEVCIRTMQEIVDSAPGMELLHGKYVLELKPEGISKGSAIRNFMHQQPFAGRTPVFAGDDTTDESGFAAVGQMGGDTLKVGLGHTLARGRCDAPADVHAWLESGHHRLQALWAD